MSSDYVYSLARLQTAAKYQHLRCLYTSDVKNVCGYSPRPMRRKCSNIGPVLYARFPDFPLLRRDSGFCLTIPKKEFYHAVALYRCKDGSLVYHDSSLGPVPLKIRQYRRKHGVHRIYVTKIRHQHPTFNTCGYHSVAFLDFASSYGATCGRDLAKAYDDFMSRGEGDYDSKVIAHMFTVIGEYASGIDLLLPKGDTDDYCVVHKYALQRIRKRKRCDADGDEDESPAKRSRSENNQSQKSFLRSLCSLFFRW